MSIRTKKFLLVALTALVLLITEAVIFGLHWPWFGRTEEQKEMYRRDV